MEPRCGWVTSEVATRVKRNESEALLDLLNP